MQINATKLFIKLGATLVSLCATFMPAMAHHPLAGKTPDSFFEGFLSGIGHPMIGLDHFAFIVAVGVVSLFLARRFLAPVMFVGGTLLGAILIYNGVGLPAVELVIALSVVLIGLTAMWGRQFGWGVISVVFAAAGLFHGAAYGGAIIGAQNTPLFAYLAGFGIIQYLIALLAGFLVGSLFKAQHALDMAPRLLGAGVVGVGVTFLFEHVEPAIIASIQSLMAVA